MRLARTAVLAALLPLLVSTLACVASTTEAPAQWFDSDDVTIAVTDSGLGGLDVVADLERRLREAHVFRNVHIVFFNALFSPSGGYNSLASREDKIRHFDRALASLSQRYEPDVIVVACNTLSVLIPDTAFAPEGRVPLVSIVEPGVALMAEFLRDTPNGQVLLFATRTTVEEDSHRAALARAGHDPKRVITQSCPELASTIERGFDSEDTELLIATFVDEAVEKLGAPSGPVSISLNCSHYPYAQTLWLSSLEEYGLGPLSVLNPNREMVDLLLAPAPEGRFRETRIAVTVVSKVEISELRRHSVGRAIRGLSSPTADALLAYELLPELF
jgi:glutamate racemase